MNKKGQSLGLSIMAGLLFLLVGFMAVNFIITEVNEARANLECSDAGNIQDGNKLLCLVVGITIPYWIWIILAVSIGAITTRFIL